MEYIAFIYKEEERYVSVVPDLNYVLSFGDTFVEVVHNTKESCELYCEDSKTLPKPLNLEELMSKRHELDIPQDTIPQLINVKVEKLRRINVMMRSDIIDALPPRLVEFNGNRSAYVQNLILQDLQSHDIAL